MASKRADGRMSRRLLYVVNDAGYFLSHRSALAQAAISAGWEVHVATAFADGPDLLRERIRALGVIPHAVPVTRFGLRLDRELWAVWSIFRLMRVVKPELVHLVALKAVLVGGLAAAFARVPARIVTIAGLGYVFDSRGWRERLARAVFRLALLGVVSANTRIIVQNSEDMARIAVTGFIARRGVLIPGSGVDLDYFHPSPEPPGPVVVLMPSRMLWNKGVAVFVAAARDLRAAGVAARFHLAGDTDPGNPAEVPPATLAAWSDSGVVDWLGHVEDMPALLAASHIVCLPSSYGEGVPKSLIEAAAAGRAIVATDIAGCREIVRDGENGLLVPPRDAPALAAALRRLIDDGTLRQRFGARGRAIAQARFGIADVVAATLAVYRELTP